MSVLRTENKNQRIKQWQLKGDKHLTFKKKIIEEEKWESQSSANLIWDKMFKKIAKPILGESKGLGLSDKESWWQNEDVAKNRGEGVGFKNFG